MTDELGEVVADDTVHQIGTFNGNPLVMAAAEATLTEVLTDDAYDEARGDERAGCSTRCQEIIDRVRPARLHARAWAPRAASIFSPEPHLRVPRLPDQGRRRALDPRLALPHEPRHLHDAGRRGGVDALDRPPSRSTSTATSRALRGVRRADGPRARLSEPVAAGGCVRPRCRRRSAPLRHRELATIALARSDSAKLERAAGGVCRPHDHEQLAAVAERVTGVDQGAERRRVEKRALREVDDDVGAVVRQRDPQGIGRRQRRARPR